MVYDILIIGAGPGGTISAFRLLEKSEQKNRELNILLLEKEKSLERIKACGGQVSGRVVREMPDLREIVCGHSIGSIFYIDGKYKTTTKDDQYFFTRFGKERSFDLFLANLVSKKGAEIKFNKKVTKIDNNKKDYATVFCQDGTEYGARIVIDASGATSSFYDKLVEKRKAVGQRMKYLCKVVECELDNEEEEIVINLLTHNNKLYHVRNDIKAGIIGCFWIFYFNKAKRANIGVGIVPTGGFDLGKEFETYLEETGLKKWGKVYTWFAPFELNKKLCTNHVLWIGDSCGMCDALSAHGIPTIWRVSDYLADACLRALKKKDYSSKTLNYYQKSAFLFLTGLKGREKLMKFVNKAPREALKKFTETWFIHIIRHQRMFVRSCD